MTTESSPPAEPQDGHENPARARQARAYESAHNRLWAVRIGLMILLIAAYLFSGASAELANGLRARFGDAWWWTHAGYVVITLFAFSAVLFPLSLYSGHYLEHRYGLSRQSMNSWLLDYLKGLALEMLLMTAFLSLVYALLRWSPDRWWLWTTAAYIALSVVLSSVWPVWIMPWFHRFDPLEESDLTAAVRRFAEQSGLEVLGVFRWGLGDKTETANAALTGIGKTRRIILSDTMLERYSRDEIIAVLAHEVGHFKHGDLWRMMAAGSALAALGFYVAHLFLRFAVTRLGFEGIADIGAFPVFLFALLLCSLTAMPLNHAYSRRREYAADAYAVRAVGSAEPLATALSKLADQNLADTEPPAWIEWLLHSHPSIKRRIARARAVAQTPPA